MRRLMRGFAAAVAAASMVSTASYAQEELVVENEVQESSGERTEMTVIAGDGFAAPMIFSTTETLGSGEGPAIRMMAAPGAGFSFSGGGDAAPSSDVFNDVFPMDDSIAELLRKKLITREEAIFRSENPDRFNTM